MPTPLNSLLRFWFVLIVAAIGGVVAFFNQKPILVSLPYFGSYETPLGFALIAAFILGASLVVFYFFVEFLKKSLQIRSLKKQVERLEGNHSQEL